MASPLSDAFVIEGGVNLQGDIIPQGAKNEALQVICAVLLTDQSVVLHNVPDILDVRLLIELLEGMGVVVERLAPNNFRFTAAHIDLDYVLSEDYLRNASRIRGSVMLIGPLLARFGKASLPRPGGDKIGRRRLDTHLLGLEQLGAHFSYDTDRGIYTFSAASLVGKHVLMEETLRKPDTAFPQKGGRVDVLHRHRHEAPGSKALLQVVCASAMMGRLGVKSDSAINPDLDGTECMHIGSREQRGQVNR